jgi:3-methyladenine DNA glycosylase Tag
MLAWKDIYRRAVERHGEERIAEHMPRVASEAELRSLGDDRYLAAMTQRVFAAGFRWRVIQAKWEGFEEAFNGFDPAWVASLDGEGIAALAQDTRIVRNRPKIVSTVENAAFVGRIAAEHGSFGDWIAAWPRDDTLGLWAALKDGGSRLGGDTGAWVLRLVGRDTFRFSSDVGAALVDAGIVDKPPTGKRAQRAAQDAINAWAEESGLSLGGVSVVLAMSTGEVYRR